MDNFMDKIAQKLNAQEMIRANSAADAAQIEKLQAQNEEYEACMKEMRKLNLKNMENEQKFKELLEQQFAQSSSDLKALTQECLAKLEAFQKEADEVGGEKETLEEIKAALQEHREKLEELFGRTDDFVHKESVKVYRNVQAVVVEELAKQTQALTQDGADGVRREKRMLIIGSVTLAAALVNIGILIIHILGIL